MAKKPVPLTHVQLWNQRYGDFCLEFAANFAVENLSEHPSYVVTGAKKFSAKEIRQIEKANKGLPLPKEVGQLGTIKIDYWVLLIPKERLLAWPLLDRSEFTYGTRTSKLTFRLYPKYANGKYILWLYVPEHISLNDVRDWEKSLLADRETAGPYGDWCMEREWEQRAEMLRAK